MPKIINYSQAIKNMKTKHKNKYSYDNFIYKKATEKSFITCSVMDDRWDLHGDFLMSYDCHLRGAGCPKCSNNKNYTQKEAIDKMQKLHKNIYKYGNFIYENNSTKSFITCQKTDEKYGYHGDFLMSLACHTKDKIPAGCPKCSNNKKLTNEIIDQRIIEQRRDKEIKRLGDVVRANEKLEWCCLKMNCDNCWFATPNNILNRKDGCPKCRKSKMQKEAERILKKFDVVFESEKWFKNLKYKGYLYFDVWIPKLKFVIELHGKQHYEPVCFGGISKERATLNLKRQIIKDQIKRDYCKKNDLFLLEISYKDTKNIENIIKTKLIIST